MNPAWIKILPKSLRARVEGRAYLQNVISSIGWQVADYILRMGIGLVIGIWMAHFLGPEQFGILNYALAFVGIFAAFAPLGLEDIVIRELVSDLANRMEILGSAFFLHLAGCLVSFFAAVGAILVMRPADSSDQVLVVIVAAGILFQGFNILEYWFYSQVLAKYVVFARNAAFLICSFIKVILILTGQPLIAFAWVATLEFALGSGGLIIAYLTRNDRFRDWRFSLKRAGGLLRDSWPLLFSAMAITVYMRIDQVMLGQMTGSEEVGVFSVAVRLTEVWMFIPYVIFSSVYPAVVEARAWDEALLYERLQKLYNLMGLAAYAVCLPVSLSARWLVPVLFGEAYARAGLMLLLLIWSNVFANLEIARSAFLSSMNWTKLHLVTLLLGCVLNIVLNILLIPRYGGMGAVVGSLIAYWFAAHGTCFLFRPLYRTGIMLTRAMLYPKIW